MTTSAAVAANQLLMSLLMAKQANILKRGRVVFSGAERSPVTRDSVAMLKSLIVSNLQPVSDDRLTA